jgi:hypothetical protein
VAPQALALLNGSFVRARAVEFAARLIGAVEDDAVEDDVVEDDDQQAVDLAFRLALCRRPSETELSASLEFVRSQSQRRAQRGKKSEPAKAREAALADFCQSLFGLNEFIYID